MLACFARNRRCLTAVARLSRRPHCGGGPASSILFTNHTSKTGGAYAPQDLKQRRTFSNVGDLNTLEFDEVCCETLESLCDYFEDIVENSKNLKGADVVYGDGVLTVSFGDPHGTYVINRQTPNKQIWLSSPTSGPKRYDYFKDKKCWIYKHNNVSLHQLLQSEIPKICQTNVDFSQCAYSLV